MINLEKTQKLVKIKASEYARLRALAKSKGLKYVAPYIYVLIEKEMKARKLTDADLSSLGEKTGDFW